MNPRDEKNVKNFSHLQSKGYKSKREATEDLLNLIGNSRQKTEEKQTPWFTLIKKQYLQANRF